MSKFYVIGQQYTQLSLQEFPFAAPLSPRKCPIGIWYSMHKTLWQWCNNEINNSLVSTSMELTWSKSSLPHWNNLSLKTINQQYSKVAHFSASILKELSLEWEIVETRFSSINGQLVMSIEAELSEFIANWLWQYRKHSKVNCKRLNCSWN